MIARKGIAFVEFLILIIIVCVLALVVVPQLTEASVDVRDREISSDLRHIRGWIDVYRLDHGGACPTDQFIAQMTLRTNAAGQVMPIGADPHDYPFGPYLSAFPANPYVGPHVSCSVEVESSTPGGGNAGWHYNPQTGMFFADSDAQTGL